MEKLLQNYVDALSKNDLTYLYSRFQQNIPGDCDEIVEFLCKTPAIDEQFLRTNNANEFYGILDLIKALVYKKYQ